METGGYQAGVLTAVLARAVLPASDAMPAMLTAAGIASLLQTVQSYTQEVGSAFCVSKYRSAIEITKLLCRFELTLLLPPAYLAFQSVTPPGFWALLGELTGRRQSNGEESLFNPCYLPTKKGLAGSTWPLYVGPARLIRQDSLQPMVYLWRYFYAFATNRYVDSDSRRMALILLRLVDRHIELTETGRISIFESAMLADSIRQLMQVCFMDDHPAVLFHADTLNACRHGRDTHFWRQMTGSRIPALSGGETPIDLAGATVLSLRRAFYEKNPLMVCGDAAARILAGTKEILAEILLRNGFSLGQGPTLIELRHCTSGDLGMDAVYRVFNRTKKRMFHTPDALMTAILREIENNGVEMNTRRTDFVSALAVTGVVDMHMRLVQDLCTVCCGNDNLSLQQAMPVIGSYFEGLQTALIRIDGILSEIFSTNKKDGVSVRLFDAFSAYRSHIDKLLLSVGEFMSHSRRCLPDSMIEEKIDFSSGLSRWETAVRQVCRLVGKPLPTWGDEEKKIELSVPNAANSSPHTVMACIQENSRFYTSRLDMLRGSTKAIQAKSQAILQHENMLAFLRFADSCCSQMVTEINRSVETLSFEKTDSDSTAFFACTPTAWRNACDAMDRCLAKIMAWTGDGVSSVDAIRDRVAGYIRRDMKIRLEEDMVRRSRMLLEQIQMRIQGECTNLLARIQTAVDEEKVILTALLEIEEIKLEHPALLMQPLFYERSAQQGMMTTQSILQFREYAARTEERLQLLAASKAHLECRQAWIRTAQKGILGIFWRIRRFFSGEYRQLLKNCDAAETALYLNAFQTNLLLADLRQSGVFFEATSRKYSGLVTQHAAAERRAASVEMNRDKEVRREPIYSCGTQAWCGFFSEGLGEHRRENQPYVSPSFLV